MGQRDAIRAVMILTEAEVDIARWIRDDKQFNTLSEKLNEVKTLILTQTFPYENKTNQNQSPQNEGC